MCGQSMKIDVKSVFGFFLGGAYKTRQVLHRPKQPIILVVHRIVVAMACINSGERGT